MDLRLLWCALESRLPATLDLLRQMVALNSWTDNRDGVNRLGRFTAAAFAELGFTAEFVPSVNPAYGDHLFLRRAGRSARSVALVSHLDTVFPPDEEARNDFRWRPEGDRIYGPGTEDIKGGTAMMWLVLHTLRELDPAAFDAVEWRLCWNASEEVLSADFGRLCRERLGPETLAALVFEAEGREGAERRLVVARKGRATWTVGVTGRGAHAGGRHATGANAIVQLGATVQRIAALTDYGRELTFNVAAITGGGGLNRVPHAATAAGEFRAFDPAVYAAAKASLMALAGTGEVRSVQGDHACAVAVEITDESAPWPRNAGTDRLLALWQAAGAYVGVPVGRESRGGLSDGNQLWDFVPTLDGLGPSGDNAHCSERSADGSKVPEYVEVSSFVPKAAINVAALQRLITGAG
jgi:glutamate carboxypeptidase